MDSHQKKTILCKFHQSTPLNNIQTKFHFDYIFLIENHLRIISNHQHQCKSKQTLFFDLVREQSNEVNPIGNRFMNAITIFKAVEESFHFFANFLCFSIFHLLCFEIYMIIALKCKGMTKLERVRIKLGPNDKILS